MDYGEHGDERSAAERRIAGVFDEEMRRLLALPAPLPLTDIVTPVAVDKSAFVRLDTNRYYVAARTMRRADREPPQIQSRGREYAT